MYNESRDNPVIPILTCLNFLGLGLVFVILNIRTHCAAPVISVETASQTVVSVVPKAEKALPEVRAPASYSQESAVEQLPTKDRHEIPVLPVATTPINLMPSQNDSLGFDLLVKPDLEFKYPRGMTVGRYFWTVLVLPMNRGDPYTGMRQIIDAASDSEAHLIRLLLGTVEACKGPNNVTCPLSATNSYGMWNDLEAVVVQRAGIYGIGSIGESFKCAFDNLTERTSEKEYFDCLEVAKLNEMER